MPSAVEITEEQKVRAADSLHRLPLARLIGMRLIDLRDGEATISIDMRDELRQPGGVLHGGVTATLIDTAMAFAVIPGLAPGERTTTVDLTVHYLSLTFRAPRIVRPEWSAPEGALSPLRPTLLMRRIN